ncbi:MAG TPA: alcohol dehydrogenase catalytic domain-containing protein [Acidobacteriota bacterium]|nr:alcohol dehydrogenase catalytic domain-containing protein [Acidobacteriota bacterium]
MKALFLSGPGDLQLRETRTQVTPPGWVRIRMRYVGICGSDLHYYSDGRIGDQVVTEPFVLGHEGSGELCDRFGALLPGTPIYVEPAVSCHQCDQCLAGRENTCRKLRFLGNPSEMSGCMCDEITMPSECVVPIPGWMSLDEAVLLEPLCIGIYAVTRSPFGLGSSAAIVGAGPIGLSVLLALSDTDPAQVFISEPIPARRQAAEALGATRTFAPSARGAADAVTEASGGGVAVAFECAGTQESIDDAAAMLKPGGTLVLIGIPEGNGRVSYDPHLLRRREITVLNIRRQNKAVERAISLLERRRDAAGVLITHRFPPTRARDAFEMLRRKTDKAIKVLLEF